VDQQVILKNLLRRKNLHKNCFLIISAEMKFKDNSIELYTLQKKLNVWARSIIAMYP